jgi:hypothetical protein
MGDLFKEKMKVKGINKAYDVEVKEIMFEGKKCIVITCGNFVTGMTSVVITKENWEKLKND